MCNAAFPPVSFARSEFAGNGDRLANDRTTRNRRRRQRSALVDHDAAGVSVDQLAQDEGTQPPEKCMPSYSRRDFLKTASAATLAALSAGAPKLWAAEPIEKIAPTADTI